MSNSKTTNAPAPFVRPEWATTEKYYPRVENEGDAPRVESDVFYESRDVSTVAHVSAIITRSDTESDQHGFQQGAACIELWEDASPAYPAEQLTIDLAGDRKDDRNPAVRARAIAAALLDAADEYDRVSAL